MNERQYLRETLSDKASIDKAIWKSRETAGAELAPLIVRLANWQADCRGLGTDAARSVASDVIDEYLKSMEELLKSRLTSWAIQRRDEGLR